MKRPLCICGNMCKKNGISKVDGRQLYNSYCRSCAKTKHGKKERINKILKRIYVKDVVLNLSILVS